MDDALTTLGEQLHATSRMAWQNRQALDWVLAEKGVCCLVTNAALLSPTTQALMAHSHEP